MKNKNIKLTITVIFSMLTFMGCSSDVKQHSVEQKKIIGTWMMCSKQSPTKAIKYLVCSEIEFSEKGKGSVDKGEEMFKWDISGDTLFITESNHSDTGLFSNSIYLMSFKQDTDGLELRLKKISSDWELVLGK